MARMANLMKDEARWGMRRASREADRFSWAGSIRVRTGGLDESEAEQRLAELTAELRELQELMFAAETNGILVILQGMDASGKDVTIGNVFAAADPASCRVAAFKEPTPEEEAHHFLWRADRLTPGHGELVIFDRSYYEQVILPQVHDELPEDEIRRRFANINEFERLLHEHGIIVVKVFLHVSEEEQSRRLEEREANPLETAWKISASGLAGARVLGCLHGGL